MAQERSIPRAIIIISLNLLWACQCTDRDGGFDETAATWAVTGSTASSTGPTTNGDDASSAVVEAGESSEGLEEDDSARFVGVFHAEPWTIPIGEEVSPTGSEKVANLEIRADGTASMMMETCSLPKGTLRTELTWKPLPGPWIELLPGPGEDVLRFLDHDSPSSVRATIDDECTMMYEIDGTLITYQPFRPGRVCWVNRCMPNWTVHIDYCDGEPPPSQCG